MAVYDYEYLKKEVYALTKIDLNAYKEAQMKRRIDALIAKNKIKGYENFVKALKTDHSLFEAFVNYLTINVSEFYRNSETLLFRSGQESKSLIGLLTTL
mgnify:CR=1 FL=1